MGQYAAARRQLHRPLRPAAEWTPDFVQQVQQGMTSFMEADVADSSKKSYDAGVQRYMRYCTVAGKQLRPQAAAVAEFIACMVTANYKLSSIAVTMASLRRWARQQWQCGEVMEAQEVQQALKVARRLAVQEQRQKLPLAADDLLAVVDSLGGTAGGKFTAVRDAAMFVVGWAGLLRSSEIVGLDWEDVHFTTGGEVMMYLPRSKTDPGAGAWAFLGSGDGGNISPAAELRQLQLLAGGTTASGPVFRTFQASTTRLRKNTIGPRLKKALAKAGVAAADMYAAHSLRRGGATHAAHVGVHTRLIQVMGRWKSDAVRQYLYTSPQQLFDASQRMLPKGAVRSGVAWGAWGGGLK
jgi:site-specific recombinase XerD